MVKAWQDARAGHEDIYIQRLDPTGFALWGDDGRGVCVDGAAQLHPVLCGDGHGGEAQEATEGEAADIAQRLCRIDTSK